MTAGEIKKEALLVVERVTVKADEDIEQGEVIYNDGNGVLAAPNTVDEEKLYVALEAHDYSAASEHYIRAVLMGCVSVQKKSGNAIYEGDLVMLSSTAGEVDRYDDYSDQVFAGTSGYWTSTLYSNLQTLAGRLATILGTAAETVASDATEIDVWVGVK